MRQIENNIPDSLQLHPGQQSLTPEQEAEARRFAEAYIQTQLSTEPVDEQEAEALLQQVYQVAKLSAPVRIQWLDGPLQLVALTAPKSGQISLGASIKDHISSAYLASGGITSVSSIWKSVRASVIGGHNASVLNRLRDGVITRIKESIRDSLRGTIPEYRFWVSNDPIQDNLQASVAAYSAAYWLPIYLFCNVYLSPNDLAYLAHFNKLVSGYWLGTEGALIVRRPRMLSHDEAGRLHSATSKAIEYSDGWGLYAWHGVRVPDKVILAPETLTRDDFLNEPNAEVRRIIQERMGQRFVLELGGVVIDSNPRGTLYEVALPDDPERVARYVQVQDASSPRQYFLRVPPTIRTAAEAVAWSFNLPAGEYNPVEET